MLYNNKNNRSEENGMIPLQLILSIEDPQDRDFMESLYNSYHRLIYSEIKKILKNDWDTEDVQQMVLIRLIGKISLLRSLDRNRLINYIISTAKNASFNYIRDNKRWQNVSFDEDVDFISETHASEDDRLIMLETWNDISEAWHALDPRSQLLLESKYILEKSNEEIAAEIGVNASSVRMLLTRARKKLKEEIIAKGRFCDYGANPFRIKTGLMSEYV